MTVVGLYEYYRHDAAETWVRLAFDDGTSIEVPKLVRITHPDGRVDFTHWENTTLDQIVAHLHWREEQHR